MLIKDIGILHEIYKRQSQLAAFTSSGKYKNNNLKYKNNDLEVPYHIYKLVS